MTEAPVLHGQRVTLRPFTDDDIEPLARIVAEPEIAKWWVGYDAPRLRREMIDDEQVIPFAIELDGLMIGTVMYQEEDDQAYRMASIDVTIDTAHLDQGLGTEAMRTLARYLFEERGHHRLTIDPAITNDRAVRAYEKVGFRPVGIMREYERLPDGTYRDGLLMDMLEGELR